MRPSRPEREACRLAGSRPTVRPVQRRLAEDLRPAQRLTDRGLVGMAGQREAIGEGREHEAVVVGARRWARAAPARPTEIVATLLRRGSTRRNPRWQGTGEPPRK